MPGSQSNQVDRTQALRQLDFGNVDSESEQGLDRRFVRTADFDRFLKPEIWLALGAKGTGKSALFELFTKYEDTARVLAPRQLRDVWITAGTGFADLSEISTGDLTQLRAEQGYDHEKLWRLYLAVRAGLALASSSSVPNGPLNDLLKALGERRDLRIGPLLKSLWRLVIGRPPDEVTIAAKGTSVTIRGGNRNLDVVTLLQDVEKTLTREGKYLWILFDKIDEIFPTDREERIRALEGLMSACMSVRRTFPHIQPKVLLRNDLWRLLQFTNKSHLADKQIELKWNSDQVATLILKRAVDDNLVWELAATEVDHLIAVAGVEELTEDERTRALEVILPPSAYPGQNEAHIIDWLVARITDAQGTVLPRESILLCKTAAQLQLETGHAAAESLIGREAMRSAFTATSGIRCATYLAEFPELARHFERFQGQTSFQFTRQQIGELMNGLSPAGGDLLREMCEIGVLQPQQGDVATAQIFEVPRLYRPGLGLVIRGRP